MRHKTYKGLVSSLKENQIYTFGSNTEGRHAKGAALQAMNFGAIYGQASGLQGQSYAIITKDLKKKRHPSITTEVIIAQIKTLYEFAEINLNLDFLIAYSVWPNLNYYSPIEMAHMFAYHDIPENIVFEEEFYKLINEELDRKNSPTSEF